MGRGRKSSNKGDVCSNVFNYDYEEYNDDTFNGESGHIDIETIVNKLDLRMPLEEIAAEENISIKSLVSCIDYLKEQKINIDTNFYSEHLHFDYSSASLENSFDEF